MATLDATGAPTDKALHGVMLGQGRVHDPRTGTTTDSGTLLFRISSNDFAPRLLAGDMAEIDPGNLKPEPGKFALFNEPNGAGVRLQRVGPANAHLQVLGALRSFHFGSDCA